jgi:hypothetical protein
VPDPRVTNPELFDLTKPDAPIPQFVNAMREVGVTLDPAAVAESLETSYQLRQGPNGKSYVLTVYKTENNPYAMGLIAEQNDKGEWVWREATWKDIIPLTNNPNLLIGVEVDPGHPNDDEAGYRNFVMDNVNYFVVSGAMSHQWIRYGRTFVPQWVNEYKRRNPNTPLVLGIGHLFYHHDSFPPELSDSSIPPERRKALTQEFMFERAMEVLRVVKPLMEKYPDLRVEFNLGNEVVWHYRGNFGWEGEYSDYPLYDNLGKQWILEAYQQFSKAREEVGLPPERFIILWNETHIQLGTSDPKTQYFIDQFKWFSTQLPNQNPEVEIGIQFGLGHEGGADVPPTIELIQTPRGRQQLRSNLFNLSKSTGRRIYITEHVAPDWQTTAAFLETIFEDKKNIPPINMINFWNALNRNYKGSFILNKENYQRLPPWYQLFYYLVEAIH